MVTPLADSITTQRRAATCTEFGLIGRPPHAPARNSRISEPQAPLRSDNRQKRAPRAHQTHFSARMPPISHKNVQYTTHATKKRRRPTRRRRQSMTNEPVPNDTPTAPKHDKGTRPQWHATRCVGPPRGRDAMPRTTGSAPQPP